jgi:DNA-directed RNA polymerase beta subunit
VVIEREDFYPARVSLDIFRNTPDSKYAQKYDSKKFPIHCAFTVASKNSHLIDEIREVVKESSKDELRYSKQTNHYAGVTLHIFTNKADLIRPVAEVLKGKELFIDKLGERNEKVFPRDLVKMAQEAQKETAQGVRQ